MKRLIFDVYELAPGAGKSIGIYNYAKHLFHALLQSQRRDLTIVLVCTTAAAADFLPVRSSSSVECHVLPEPWPSKLRRMHWMLWRAAHLCRRLKADIYFSPKGFLPFGITSFGGRPKTVVTVHDLIILWYRQFHPRYFGLVEELLVSYSILRAVRRADAVITISEFSKRDIIEKVATNKPVSVIYNGIEAEEILSTGMGDDYIFSVSSPLPHKNAQTLIKAYERYRQLVKAPKKLIVCGISDPGVEGIEVTGRISDIQLRQHYKNATVFVFCSLIEGFGFPPLEAMMQGTPVICSDIEVLREVTKGAGIFVPPENVEALAVELASVMQQDASKRAEAAQLRREIALSYRWDQCARSFLTVAMS